MPLSGTTIRFPKRRLIEVVAEMASPEESIAAICEVPGLRRTGQYLESEGVGKQLKEEKKKRTCRYSQCHRDCIRIHCVSVYLVYADEYYPQSNHAAGNPGTLACRPQNPDHPA